MSPELTATVEATEKKAPKAKKAPKDKSKGKPAIKKEPKEKGTTVTPNMLRVLQALKSGKEMTAAQLADKTSIVKGKRLPQLVEMGLIKEMIPDEGKRGKRFVIMTAGRKALDK